MVELLKLKKNQLCLILLMLWLSLNAWATPKAPWKSVDEARENDNPFYFYANNDTLRTALIKIAQVYNVRVHFSKYIPDDVLDRPILGKFRVPTAEVLFNRLTEDYGLNWFYYGGILYINDPKNDKSRTLYVAPDLIANFKNVLINDGIFNKRFGWSEIPSQGMIIVSGPEEYIDFIVKKMKTLNIAPADQQFAVFRLHNAFALDRPIQTNNGTTIVIPGVSTILKALLQGPQSIKDSGVDNKILQQVIEPIQNSAKSLIPTAAPAAAPGQAISGLAGQAPTADGDGMANKATASAPLIQADNRLNAIIIRDKSGNMPMYKALIDLLDVPSPLVQVQVLIVDIDQVKMNQAGVSWWANTPSGGKGNGALLGASSGNSTGNSLTSVNPSNLIVDNLSAFLKGLRFLEAKGMAKAESKSAVVTLDNIAAVVNLTESFYTSNGQGTQPVQTQTQMQIIPHIIYDEDKTRISLSVSLQDGNVEEKMVNGLPATLQGQLNSQAVVDEGSSLLLAGFTHKQTETVHSQVPILGSIPIVGMLFKDNSSSQRSMQRVYLVTPTIISTSGSGKGTPSYTIVNPDEQSSSKKSKEKNSDDSDSIQIQLNQQQQRPKK